MINTGQLLNMIMFLFAEEDIFSEGFDKRLAVKDANPQIPEDVEYDAYMTLIDLDV